MGINYFWSSNMTSMMLCNFIDMATRYTWKLFFITYAQFEFLIFVVGERTTVFLVVESWNASIIHPLRELRMGCDFHLLCSYTGTTWQPEMGITLLRTGFFNFKSVNLLISEGKVACSFKLELSEVWTAIVKGSELALGVASFHGLDPSSLSIH